MSEIYFAYELKHFANKGKIEKIKSVLKEYRKTAKEFLNTNLPKRKVLKVLLKQYLDRFKGCCGAPLELFNGNPYFRDYLEKFLNLRHGLP